MRAMARRAEGRGPPVHYDECGLAALVSDLTYAKPQLDRARHLARKVRRGGALRLRWWVFATSECQLRS